MKRKEGKHKESGTDLISYTVKSGVAPVQHSYKVRENYMTKADLNVRVTAAGALKRWNKLTTSGKSHSDNVDGYAVMQKRYYGYMQRDQDYWSQCMDADSVWMDRCNRKR